jgi:hypothetical protein
MVGVETHSKNRMIDLSTVTIGHNAALIPAHRETHKANGRGKRRER